MTDLTLSNISNISTIENTNRAINVLVDDQVIETEEAWRICGCALMSVLYDPSRRQVVAIRQIEGQWGYSWLIGDDYQHLYSRKFIPTGGTSKVQKDMCLEERMAWVPAKAVIRGRGTGLSGSAWASYEATGWPEINS